MGTASIKCVVVWMEMCGGLDGMDEVAAGALFGNRSRGGVCQIRVAILDAAHVR